MRMTGIGWLSTTLLLLAGCASDDGLQASSIANQRPECLVGGDPITASRDSGMSARDRDCGTDRSLRWSSDDNGNGKQPMKVEFGKTHD